MESTSDRARLRGGYFPLEEGKPLLLGWRDREKGTCGPGRIEIVFVASSPDQTKIMLRVNYFTVDYQGEVQSSVVIYSQKGDVKSIGSGISCETVGILGNKASIRVTWPEDFWCMYRDVIEVMPWGRSSPGA